MNGARQTTKHTNILWYTMVEVFMLQIGNLYTIECVDISVEGAGIGRIEGVVVFVPGLLPGEAATVRIVKTQKNYAAGELVELRKASPNRVEVPCPYFDSCGGCTLMHLSYHAQFAWKKSHVIDCFKKFAAIEVEPEVNLAAEKPLHYRNKATFFIKGKQIGYYVEKSHKLVPISTCLLVKPQINAALQSIQNWLVVTETNTNLLQKMTVRANAKGELLVGFMLREYDRAVLQEILHALKSALPQIKGVLYRVTKTKTPAAFTLLWGESILQERFAGLTFDVALDSFLQVNHKMAEALYQTAFDIGKIEKEDAVLDVYSGVGTLTLLAAQRAKKAYGVEIIPSAVRNAKRNASNNKIENVEFSLADATESFEIITEKVNAIIVDPPRRGLSPALIGDIVKQNIPRVIYISCNPATLARDAKLFLAEGYAVEKLAIVDMFAQTTHVESVAILSKLKLAKSI